MCKGRNLSSSMVQSILYSYIRCFGFRGPTMPFSIGVAKSRYSHITKLYLSTSHIIKIIWFYNDWVWMMSTMRLYRVFTIYINTRWLKIDLNLICKLICSHYNFHIKLKIYHGFNSILGNYFCFLHVYTTCPEQIWCKVGIIFS